MLFRGLCDLRPVIHASRRTVLRKARRRRDLCKVRLLSGPQERLRGAAVGPLEGVKVLEIAGIGPGPFAAMMLSDMGAEVLRIDRTKPVLGDPTHFPASPLNRGRRSVGIDLKHPDGVATVLRLVETADVLIEGFRPGVMERLGLGPDVCMERNPVLVYGRITGWGREGPLAHMAGHDINYIALSGALAQMGREGEIPVPPANLLGDFGGGGMLLAFGVVCGLFDAWRSSVGQVVDAAMVDGAALLTTMLWGLRAKGDWSEVRGTNMLDTGAPFYEVYTCADGEFITVGALEPKFYFQLLDILGLDPDALPDQLDRAGWPSIRAKFTAAFLARTRDEWCDLLGETDVCFAPVLSMSETVTHPHIAQRATFSVVDGMTQPSPAPRFDRTPGSIQSPPPIPGEHTQVALEDWGFEPEEIAKLREIGAISPET